MKQSAWRVFAGLLAASFLAAAAPALPAPVLEGWSVFKFGMSPDQARALPGQNFGRYNPKNLADQLLGAMASKKPATINGVSFVFDLYFNSYQALNEIGMWNEKTVSQADCNARFIGLLAQMDKNYGAFLPVYPEQKKNDQDQLPIAIAWKTGEGASRYQIATVYFNAETAYAWEARKHFGNRFVDVSAVWSAPSDDQNSVCLTELDFKS